MKDNLILLQDVLRSAHSQDFAGYSKFDALNSPFLRRLSLDNSWLKFIIIQLIKESPFNFRPLFGVKPSRNPKGIALFSRAYLFLYELTQEPQFLDQATELLDWLLENSSPNQKNFCWGYNFEWQSVPPFNQHIQEPNLVVTCFVGEAIVHGFRVTENSNYLHAMNSVARFLTSDLPVLFEDKNERAIAYVQSEVDSIVLNNQVMSAALLVKIWHHSSELRLLEIAQKQARFTVNRRTDYFAWPYAIPLNNSKPVYINYHDNYHTGGVLDGILEYCEETSDEEFIETYWRGLKYYAKNLFEADGAPRWSDKRKFPLDIHSSAQGIISFSKAARYRKEYLELAEKILDWTVDHLYRPHTQNFAYRQGRFLKWNYSLMRWCNGWMSRAIGEYCFIKNERINHGNISRSARFLESKSLSKLISA